MSHLPECYMSEGKWDGGCICQRLRDCEQRIKTHEGCADAERIEGYVDGYAAALDAAEEAVRAALGADERNLHAELTAIAAIDALREKL